MNKGQSEIDFIRCMSNIEDSLDMARELGVLLDDLHDRKRQAALSTPESEPKTAEITQLRDRRVVNE